MTEFQNKSFSVYPGKDGGEKYRDNWDRIFSKPRSALPMPSAAVQPCITCSDPAEPAAFCAKCAAEMGANNGPFPATYEAHGINVAAPCICERATDLGGFVQPGRLNADCAHHGDKKAGPSSGKAGKRGAKSDP